MLKVSIITTCYNRKATIREAIESVLNQVYSNIEYIVIDGASSDGSLEIINEYSERISKIVSEPDGGMYEAINKGIRLATGEIIGLVHSDDFLEDKDVVKDVVSCVVENNADFVYGDGVFVESKNTSKIVRRWRGGMYSPHKVALGWLPLHPTCYIKRDVMFREGLYDESYKIAADSDLLFRYLFKANIRVTYLKRNIIRMRMGGVSTSKEKRIMMFWEDVRMYRSYGRWGIPSKILKMMWKLPQFVEAKLI